MNEELSKLSTREIWDMAKKVKEDNTKIMVDFLLGYMDMKCINRFYKIYEIHSSKTISCIYFIKNNETGYIKIGKTKDLHRRIADIDSLCKNHIGGETSLKRVVLCSESELAKAENDLHKHYDKYKIRGEWYDVDNIEYDDMYFCDGDQIITINNNDVYVDFSYEDIDYDLRSELYNSIALAKLLERMAVGNDYVTTSVKYYDMSNLYKFHNYMFDNNIGFAALNFKGFEKPFDTLRVSKTDKFISLNDAYVEKMLAI